MGTNSGAYKFVLVLHLLAVVVGFGGMVLAGVLGTKAKAKGGPEGRALSEVAFDVTEHLSQWFIYAVPIFGLLLVFMSKDAWKFSQMWIGISIVLYVVFLGLLHGLHSPTLRRMNELSAEMNGTGGAVGGGPAQAGELDALAKKAAAVGGALNLIWVVVLALMVFKPGL